MKNVEWLFSDVRAHEVYEPKQRELRDTHFLYRAGFNVAGFQRNGEHRGIKTERFNIPNVARYKPNMTVKVKRLKNVHKVVNPFAGMKRISIAEAKALPVTAKIIWRPDPSLPEDQQYALVGS